MLFFTGVHDPHLAHLVPAAFISVHRLERRRTDFPVRRWVIDSGAFTQLAKHGRYLHPVEQYAAEILRYRHLGQLLAAVSQDYMCEPFILSKTGLSIAEHQRLTIERYDALLACQTGVPIMPVLQGYHPDDYVRHIRQYGARLQPRHWVGVGSVCKRNASPAAIVAVLLAIKRQRPDLRLHGFGVKITALQWEIVQQLLFSSDSMAWSFAARWEGRSGSDPNEAIAYRKRLREQPVQLHLGIA